MTVKDILKVSKFDVVIRDKANLLGSYVKIINRNDGYDYDMISALVLNAEVKHIDGYSNGTLVLIVNLQDGYENC